MEQAHGPLAWKEWHGVENTMASMACPRDVVSLHSWNTSRGNASAFYHAHAGRNVWPPLCKYAHFQFPAHKRYALNINPFIIGTWDRRQDSSSFIIQANPGHPIQSKLIFALFHFLEYTAATDLHCCLTLHACLPQSPFTPMSICRAGFMGIAGRHGSAHALPARAAYPPRLLLWFSGSP